MTYSVIVPIYKAERYLRESLDSIVGQNYADWELILVDDASPDNSLEICRSYDRTNVLKFVMNMTDRIIG